jgi:hypothetical protein
VPERQIRQAFFAVAKAENAAGKSQEKSWQIPAKSENRNSQAGQLQKRIK